jgi:hypothetical protein
VVSGMDKVVDVAELFVNAAVPLSYAGKNAFGDVAITCFTLLRLYT